MVVLGSPGAGKSMFFVSLASRSGALATYINMDSSLQLQAARVCAAKAGVKVTEVLRQPAVWANYLKYHPSSIRFVDHRVSAEQVDEVVTAHTEYWGETPTWVFVDNLKNIRRDRKKGEYEGYVQAIEELHQVARVHNCVVVVAHHVKRGDRALRSTVPHLDDGKYGSEDEAAFVLGLARPTRDVLRVGILKNREGDDSPDGSLYVDLPADFSRVRIGA